MPRLAVPVRHTSAVPVYVSQPPRAGSTGLIGLIGGLAGLLLCLLCLTTMGLLGLFATFIAVVAYLGNLYQALKTAGGSASGIYANMAILLAALCFAGYHKLRRSL